MRKLLFFAAVFAASYTFAQTSTTFAGKNNADPVNNYDSRTSNVDLDDTYFAYPNGICSAPNGRIYVAERNKIRLLTGGKAFIRGGNPGGPTLSEGYVNATGTQAKFRNPSGMVSDANGNIFICDIDNHAIRKMAKFVNTTNPQAVTTFAGGPPSNNNGSSGSANGTGTSARFNQPQGITIDGDGNFYVTDYLNFTIRKITPAGVVTTLAGQAGQDGTTDNNSGGNVKFGGPWGIAMLDDDHLVVTDQWNTNIRKVNISTGATTTIAGPTSGPNGQIVDGTLTAARFKAPKGVVVIEGIIYVNDENVIRAIDVANNTVSTFAGDKSKHGIVNGTGSAVNFTELDGMMTDGSGAMYTCENSSAVTSHIVRKVTVDALVPNADFSANITNLFVAQKTTLSDNSTGATISARTWTITPMDYTIHTGDLNSSTVELSFTKEGFYQVKLDITNTYGSDAETKANFFKVSTTGSITDYNANALVDVYPNPADHQIAIELAPQFVLANTEMAMYNAQGQLIYKGNVKNVINTAELSNGFYYLTIVSDDLKAVKKFAVNH